MIRHRFGRLLDSSPEPTQFARQFFSPTKIGGVAHRSLLNGLNTFDRCDGVDDRSFGIELTSNRVNRNRRL